MNNIVTEMKNILEETNNRLNTAQQSVRWKTAVEITAAEQKKE